MKRFLLTLWNDLLGLFYPRICGACGAPLIDGEELLCLYCLFELPRLSYHRYPDDENPLRNIFAGCSSVRQVITYLHFEKEGLVQHLIHEFKYHNNDRLAIYIGRLAARELRSEGYLTDVDLLVPVPLHPRKMRQRGYNQSERVARGLASVYHHPIDTTSLIRHTYTKTQTQKSAYERRQNVKNVFTVAHPERLAGHHILLIDDVLTTGSTLLNCIDALRDVPDLLISIFVVSTVI